MCISISQMKTLRHSELMFLPRMIRRDLCPISGKTLHRLDEEKMGLQCVVELSLFTELSPLRGHKVKRRGPHAGYRHETIEDGLAALGKAFCWGWRG